MPSTDCLRLIACAASLALVGCSNASDEGEGRAMVATSPDTGAASPDLLESMDAPPDSCLLTVWSGEKVRDIDFDRANDLVEGGAISCATGTSPSRFAAAIESLREAARSGDKARVLEQVGMPLLYIDAQGERVELDDEQMDALYDEIFDAELFGLIERLDLKDMTVSEAGGFFELGSIWLVVDKADGQPRLVTVNRQALTEAAEAARNAARADEGVELSNL